MRFFPRDYFAICRERLRMYAELVTSTYVSGTESYSIRGRKATPAKPSLINIIPARALLKEEGEESVWMRISRDTAEENAGKCEWGKTNFALRRPPKPTQLPELIKTRKTSRGKNKRGCKFLRGLL
jgi:hypothetical protein